MGRGLGRVQKLILQHLQEVNQDTVKGIIHFIYPGTASWDWITDNTEYVKTQVADIDPRDGRQKIFNREKALMPEWPKDTVAYYEKEHWIVCRALYSLEKRGLVDRRGWQKHKRTPPFAVWGLPTSSVSTNVPSAPSGSPSSPDVSTNDVSKQPITLIQLIKSTVFKDKTKVEIGDIHLLYADNDVRLQLVGCDPEEQTPLERKLGHEWRVEVDCWFNDTSFSKSGKTPNAAITAALEELEPAIRDL